MTFFPPPHFLLPNNIIVDNDVFAIVETSFEHERRLRNLLGIVLARRGEAHSTNHQHVNAKDGHTKSNLFKELKGSLNFFCCLTVLPEVLR